MTSTRTTDPRTTDPRSTDGRTVGPRTTERRAAATEQLPVVPAPADARVVVNGVDRAWTAGLTVESVVRDLLGDGTPAPAPGTATADDASCAAPTGVAAALDDAIVPRGLWASTPVPAGARLEVVTAVQGG